MQFLPDDWRAVFALDAPLLELIVRGSALYLGLLILIRLMPRRTGGELGTIDFVFVLLIAEAAAHSLGAYTSVAGGLIVIATMMVLNYGVNALSYRFRWIERLVSPPPLMLIRDGRLLRRNMRRELVTEEELMSRLHKDEIDHVRDVKRAYVEGDGQITVIPRKK